MLNGLVIADDLEHIVQRFYDGYLPAPCLVPLCFIRGELALALRLAGVFHFQQKIPGLTWWSPVRPEAYHKVGESRTENVRVPYRYAHELAQRFYQCRLVTVDAARNTSNCHLSG